MFRSFFTTIFRGSSAVLCAVTIPPADLRSLSLYYYAVCGRMFISSVIQQFLRIISTMFMISRIWKVRLLIWFIQGVPLPTKPGISLIILKPMKILQRNRHTLQTHSSSFLTQRMYSCSNLVAISSLVLELLKKCRVW